MTIKDGIKFSFGLYIGFATICAIKEIIENIDIKISKIGSNQETKTAKDTEEK